MPFSEQEEVSVKRYCRSLVELETLCQTARALGFPSDADVTLADSSSQVRIATNGDMIGAPVR